MARHTEMEYRKYVTVLREDDRRYAVAKTKRPKGKVSIEVRGDKGLLKCSVKNLSLNSGNHYHLWLVKEDQQKQDPVHVGYLTVDKSGNAEAEWGFGVSSIKESGIDLDLYGLVEVRAGGHDESLSGCRVLVGELELSEVYFSEEPAMEKVAPFGPGHSSHQWWKFYPGSANSSEPQPNSNFTGQKLDSALGVEPTSVHVLGERPKNMEANSNGCSDESDIIQTGPVFQGHHIIGLEYNEKGDVKYLIHGIPGRFCLRDQPYGGETGYVYWQPLPGQRYQAGDYGYWLIYLLPRTGEAAFPKKEIKPPDCDNCDRKEE